ncbi:hypothetical protein C8039_10365 [Halogeometricum sp. wsp3]|nr:hypothetical protein C8039_10365 [Halogeometricum sp. wsp3]
MRSRLSVESTADEDEKFGVVGALAQLIDREGVDDDLIVIGGDNLIGSTPRSSGFLRGARRAVYRRLRRRIRKKAKSYGLVELDGDRVVDFQEKPDDPKSTLVSIACYAFPAKRSAFDEYLQATTTPTNRAGTSTGCNAEPVSAFTFDDVWFDIGTPDSFSTVEWHLDGGSLTTPTRPSRTPRSVTPSM